MFFVIIITLSALTWSHDIIHQRQTDYHGTGLYLINMEHPLYHMH